MKTQLNLNELGTELSNIRENAKDYVADSAAIRFGVRDGDVYADLGNHDPLRFKPHAYGQLVTNLGVPKKFADRLATDYPDVLATTLNEIAHVESRKRLVRAFGPNIRAWLSDRYRPIDNIDLLGVALPTLQAIPNMQIVSIGLTDTNMTIKAIFPHLRGEVKVGDVVEGGVAISNSEVGAGAIWVKPFLNRLVCTNGMVSNVLSKRGTHVGKRLAAEDDIQQYLRDETREAEDRALLMKFGDVVNALSTQDAFEKVIEPMRESTERKIEGSVEATVQQVHDRFGLNDSEKDDVLRHLIEGGDISAWGLANAVTRTAEDAEDYDRATELETLGGKIVELEPREWRTLAEAA